jgi:hypothetical protein
MKVKAAYLEHRKMLIGNGKCTSFWEDAWCSPVCLRKLFPKLFEVCEDQAISVREAADRSWVLTYRRWLDGCQ